MGWVYEKLTKKEIHCIMQLLHNPRVQQEIYTNYNHPYRIYMPFLDQPSLQTAFLKDYSNYISKTYPDFFKKTLFMV
jgi:hypothetical protein